MSNDIATNQISKDALSVSATPQATTTKGSERQNTVVEEGKALPAETESVEISPEELERAVSQLNEYVQQTQRDLYFSVDDSSGRSVVRVVNSETEEVVRQIPTEDVLRISRNIQEQVTDDFSLIFETSA